jgi:hypothetical protein
MWFSESDGPPVLRSANPCETARTLAKSGLELAHRELAEHSIVPNIRSEQR